MCRASSSFSEPQPDLTLVKPLPDFYTTAHPSGSGTLLVIEVSHTTIRADLDRKIPLYARHGIPEVWLVDLRNQQVRFYRTPVDGQYTQVSTTDVPGVVAIASVQEISVDLSGVLRTAAT